ncbi:DNA-directed DNA polymerase [Alcanivorax hongdengensis A-11-3]|uniref:DNA-directed DNA polymerase n=1 Tax=Alcanivorax hongdengensis A-11-3 TaxID=1177179 RepID=L0WDZ5_9GAMM|nr:translesion error-prone DNA polymerase V subunit UmuC [Alcanivorax hongdengensis]EKF75053.1 DNA-directed DNA polymerase [Alcanivorax hongdengensis A-11-3]
MFALVDCNNFYTSCEMLFRPDLRDRPVVVLSNNDGCVVARSPLAKAMGIPMGVPAFQVRHLEKQAGLVMFSSNYALYGDMSARVMATLEQLVPEVEAYSIDEAFLGLHGLPATTLPSLARRIRRTIDRHQGLPVCVGIAPTKTLAKLANHAAKTWPATQGTVILTDPARQQRLMSLLPVGTIWGIGRRMVGHLEQLGIHTALDLARSHPATLRKRFSVVIERLVRELNGEPCLPLDLLPGPRKHIVASRSFGNRVTERRVIGHAVASHTWRASERLRQDDNLARQMTVYIRTGAKDPNYYGNAASGAFAQPTRDTRQLLDMAHRLLDQLWQPGYRYAKAGVVLTDLCHRHQQQTDLFGDRPGSDALMDVMDRINHSGKGKVWLAGQGMQADRKAWEMKRLRLSPSYTTDWQQIPEVS